MLYQDDRLSLIVPPFKISVSQTILCRSVDNRCVLLVQAEKLKFEQLILHNKHRYK